MRLAFVVQRYGRHIAGGSEAHCRHLAEHLASSHDTTVLTTCAADYVTWDNALPPGETIENDVRVVRFPVAHSRQLKAFADLSDEVFEGHAPDERQEEWFRANGPEVPGLLQHLRANRTIYDLVLFWTFRYYPSFFGLPLVAERSVLVPTAEEDPALELSIARDFFRRPAGFLFLTPEEEAIVSRRAGQPLRPAAIIGSGLEPAADRPARDQLERAGIVRPYVLYLGRVDPNKGCHTLFEYFLEWAKTHEDADLVLAGPHKMPIPDHPRIRALGYVTDDLRCALLAHAALLVVPSPYESLSMVLLESWNVAVPALVNGECQVLQGQVRRANGGLYYQNEREFAAALTFLLTNDTARLAFGRQGHDYVDREYRWPTVVERVERLLAEVVSRYR